MLKTKFNYNQIRVATDMSTWHKEALKIVFMRDLDLVEPKPAKR